MREEMQRIPSCTIPLTRTTNLNLRRVSTGSSRGCVSDRVQGPRAMFAGFVRRCLRGFRWFFSLLCGWTLRQAYWYQTDEKDEEDKSNRAWPDGERTASGFHMTSYWSNRTLNNGIGLRLYFYMSCRPMCFIGEGLRVPDASSAVYGTLEWFSEGPAGGKQVLELPCSQNPLRGGAKALEEALPKWQKYIGRYVITDPNAIPMITFSEFDIRIVNQKLVITIPEVRPGSVVWMKEVPLEPFGNNDFKIAGGSVGNKFITFESGNDGIMVLKWRNYVFRRQP